MKTNFCIDTYISNYMSVKDSTKLTAYEKSFLVECQGIGNCKDILQDVHDSLASEEDFSRFVYYAGIINTFDDRSFLPLVFRLLEDDSTKGWRKSLIYAVYKMNPLEYFEELIDIVLNEDEVTVMYAMTAISDLDGEIEDRAVVNSYHKVCNALKNPLPKWRRDELEVLHSNF